MKIQQDANILKKGTQRSIGEDIMAYLSDLWLYVNGNCTQDCSICRDAYRQFNFCTSSREKNLELSIADIKRIVEELPPGIPQNIHILGGNILSYAHLVNLLELIPADCRTSLYIHYLNADRHKEKIQHISKHNITLELLFSFPLIKEKAYRAIQALKEPGIDFRFSFSIRNTGEFEEANELIQLNPEIGATFHPLFDGTNIDFFSENIFVKAEEIERIKPSLKEVHSRGIVNPNYFGNLIIRPDGRVYADVNAPSLGKIQENSIFDILVKEVESGTSWRKVRKNVLPCKSCVFEKLCPPISNYNTAVGRFDLCSIRRQASQKKIK